jgi:hypothetical protein
MDSQQKEKPVVISADTSTKGGVFKFSYVNPKILGLLTVLLLMIGGVGTGVYLTQTPQKTTTQASLDKVDLSLQPAKSEISGGGGFTVDIFANANNNKITSATLSITYDPKVLDLKSITPRQFLPKVLLEPKISTGSAVVSLGTDGNSGISGSGILAVLTFQPKPGQSATTKIEFNQAATQINTLGNTTTGTELNSAEVKINTIGVSAPQTVTASGLTTTNESTLSGKTEVSREETVEIKETEFDFNDDGQVNSVDLSLVYSAWGEPETDTQKKADINGDGVVNGLDYSKFLPYLKR